MKPALVSHHTETFTHIPRLKSCTLPSQSWVHLLHAFSPLNVIPILHSDTLGHMVDLVNPNQPLRKLKHIISQTDNDELCVFRAFFDISCHDRDLRICVSVSDILE